MVNSNIKNDISDRTDCPSAEILLQFQRTALSKKEEDIIRRHISTCSECAYSSLLIAKTIYKEKGLVHEMRHKYANNIFFRYRIFRYSIPLSLVIIFIAIIIFYNTTHPNIAEENKTRGIELAVIEPIQTLNIDDQIILRWVHVPNNQYYVVEVFDNSLKLLWRSMKIHEESSSVPNNIKESMIAGKQYAWTVTAYLLDGRTVKSALTEFRIQ